MGNKLGLGLANSVVHSPIGVICICTLDALDFDYVRLYREFPRERGVPLFTMRALYPIVKF